MTLKISVPTALLTLKKEDNEMFQIYDSTGKMFPPTAGQWFADFEQAMLGLLDLGMTVTLTPGVKP